MEMKKLLGILLAVVGIVALAIGAMDYNTAAGGGKTLIKSIVGFGGKTVALGALGGGVLLMLIGLFFLKDMLMGKKSEAPATEGETVPAEQPAEEAKTEEKTEEAPAEDEKKEEGAEEEKKEGEEYECPSCGATVPSDAKVCPECGEEFE